MNENTKKEIPLQMGLRLQAARAFRGTTVDQLAIRSGVRTERIERYEAGTRMLDAEELVCLAGILNFPLSYLFGGPTDGPLKCPFCRRRMTAPEGNHVIKAQLKTHPVE